jgi:hypothetical protein
MKKNGVNNNDKLEIEKQYYFSFIWGLFFTLILHLSAIYAAYVYLSDIQKVSEQEELALLEKFANQKINANFSVILFGDSKLRYGLDLNDENLNDNFAYIWFSPDGASYNKLEKHLHYSLNADPDFIIIASNIISNNSMSLSSGTAKSNNIIVKASSGVFKFLYHGLLFRMSAKENWLLTRVGIDSSCLTFFSKQELDYKISFNESLYIHDINGPETKKFREFITLAINQGIQVIIIDLPSHDSLMMSYDIEPHRVNYSRLGFTPTREQLLPQLANKVLWLSLNKKLQTQHYCDFTHLNRNGRALFTDWFLNQLTQLR